MQEARPASTIKGSSKNSPKPGYTKGQKSTVPAHKAKGELRERLNIVHCGALLQQLLLSTLCQCLYSLVLAATEITRSNQARREDVLTPAAEHTLPASLLHDAGHRINPPQALRPGGRKLQKSVPG
ncbi:hypothetical protein NDU88_005209 [Pleurodeles waltl]|uniref:Uncharacterized protein n=1 Tax=Pleurodeles waltl TaxID=8319 RepID=A0AAV7VM37_PLEWA|nr:hypothetical protein NDU88_005209 [Pleurodeles waltl]